MATAIALFSNLEIKQTTADLGRTVNNQLDWMSVQIAISAVSGTNPSIEFRVQWSFDNVVWSEGIPKDVIGQTDRAASVIARFPVKSPYWRLVAVVTGTNPVFTCTANALI